ncbi:WD40 repeat-like protein [Lichtheimia hyalospora FSU 10163]|nr:WD40 repeat-like protein [Lichtheimia hyalospora FSU 10163]
MELIEGCIRKPLVIFGHTARIWDCQFVDQYLVSISEDATCRVWRNILMDGSAHDEADCLARWEGHIGKNVWSCAISPEKKMVASGGQDSGIRLWSLMSIRKNNIESEDDLAHIGLPPSQPESSFVRNFCLIDTRTAVIFTSDSYFLKVKDGQWSELCFNDGFQKYAMMESSPCGRFIVAGNMSGQMMIISTEKRFEPVTITAHKQKVFEIFIQPSQDPSVYYIVSTAFDEPMLFHRMIYQETNGPTVETQFVLERPIERTTSLSFAYIEQHRIFLAGSRESALVLYQLPCDQNMSTIQSVKPLMQLRRSHGKQAVSHITVKQDHPHDNEIVFWTTGRDGCYVQYRLVKREQNGITEELDDNKTPLGIASQGDNTVTSRDWMLERVYRNRVTKGWLEDAIWVDNELLLLGFYRKRFFVYNESKSYEMISVACGGAHRRWQFKALDAKLNLATFAFIRKEKLYAYFRDGSVIHDGFDESVLQENFHGRDVRALQFLDTLVENNGMSSNTVLFATGGEDTILRINQYSPTPQPSHITLASIRRHKSVIKSIVVSKGIDNLIFTSGGNQELWCWKLELLLPSNKGENAPVDVNCLEWASCPTVSEVIETRIMDITVHAIDSARGLHLVGAGYSDSVVRVWLFNEITRRFSLIADGSWHNRCILQTEHLVIPGSNGKRDRILFFTTATDGRIAVWDISDRLYEAIEDVAALEEDPMSTATKFTEPVYHYRAHQSGVNGLAVALQDDTIIIFTGGEDNAVAAARLRINDAGDITTLEDPFIIPGAHASSVTAVALIRNNTAALSISTDQRLNMWSLEMKDDIKVKMIDAAFVDVPDPSSMNVTEYQSRTHAAIAGIGLESFVF